MKTIADAQKQLAEPVAEFLAVNADAVTQFEFGEEFGARKSANRAARDLGVAVESLVGPKVPQDLRRDLEVIAAELVRFDIERLWRSPHVLDLVGEVPIRVPQVPPQ